MFTLTASTLDTIEGWTLFVLCLFLALGWLGIFAPYFLPKRFDRLLGWFGVTRSWDDIQASWRDQKREDDEWFGISPGRDGIEGQELDEVSEEEEHHSHCAGDDACSGMPRYRDVAGYDS